MFTALPLLTQAETGQDEVTLSTNDVHYTMQEEIVSDEELVDEYSTETSEGSVSDEQNANTAGEESVEAFSSEEVTYNFKIAGILVKGSLTIGDNAKVTAEAGIGTGRSCGTYVISNIYMKDNAQLDTKGADTSETSDFASESYGIRTTNMYVSGGTINANSGDTTSDSWAIDASSEMKITGGEVSVSTGTATKSNAIYSGNTINIKDATIEVKSQGNGIYAPYGSITVGCTEVKADQNTYELLGTRVVVSAPGEGVHADGEIVIDKLLTSSNPENNKTAMVQTVPIQR